MLGKGPSPPLEVRLKPPNDEGGIGRSPLEPREPRPEYPLEDPKGDNPEPELKGGYIEVVSPRPRRLAVPVPGCPGIGACRASLRVPARRACLVLPNLR